MFWFAPLDSLTLPKIIKKENNNNKAITAQQ